MTNFICVKPWTHITQHTNGHFSPCCKIETPLLHEGVIAKTIEQAWSSEDLENLRQSFLRGDRPSTCSQCWVEENAGGVSDRLSTNERIKHSKGEIFFTSIFNSAPSLRSLDLKISNLCNLKCRICSSSYSSKIFEERISLLSDEEKTPDLLERRDNLKASKWLNFADHKKTYRELLSNIDYLEVYGGEPFLQKDVISLLQFCSEEGFSKNIHLRFHTNGTVPLAKHIDLLKTFKLVNMVFSIDDIGKRFEYQRKGAVWIDVEENIREVLRIKNDQALENLIIEVFCTVSMYNGFYLKDLFNWAWSLNIRVSIHPVITPPYLCLQNLNPETKPLYESNLREVMGHPCLIFPQSVDALINILNKPSHYDKFVELILHIKAFDLYRGESFEMVFPELKNLLSSASGFINTSPTALKDYLKNSGH